MLMTPITPKVMARPMAASSSTEPSDMPYQRFWATLHSARRSSMAAMASAAARCTAGGLVGRQRAQQAERILVAALAHDGDGLELVGLRRIGWLRRMAARASMQRPLARARRSPWPSAVIERAAARGVVRLEHGLGGLEALGGIGRQQRQAAERGFDRAAQAIVDAHLLQAGGRARRRWACRWPHRAGCPPARGHRPSCRRD